MKNSKSVAIVLLIAVLCVCLAFAACKDTPETPTPTQLAAPQISLDSATGKVSWNKVEHADSYDVKVNTNDAINVKTTSYTFPANTAEGSYDVTVTAKSSDTEHYSASNPSNKVTYVKSNGGSGDEKTLTQLTMTAEPTKSVYFLDEGATEADFTGAAFLAKYSDNTSKALTLDDVTVGSYTMAEGDVDVTVSYTEGGVTKEFVVTFLVRERTDADINVNGVEVITNDQDAADYIVANYEATKVVNMRGEQLAITTDTITVGEGDDAAEKNVTKVANGKLSIGRNLLSVTNAEGTEFVLVVVGKLISTPAEFKAMAADVASSEGKYYVITRDLDFENGWQDPIGAAPIAVSIVDGENDEGQPAKVDLYTPDPVNGAPGAGESVNSVTNQNGVAFKGTLDGLGHTIMNYRINKDAKWKPEAYGVAMFGWLGQDAKICNLNLRNVSIGGGAHTAILVGVNSGTIENVSIEENCIVNSAYNRGAAFVGYNFGTIKNVVSLAERYVGFHEAEQPLVLALNASAEEDTTVTKGFIGKDDHTTELGGGWRYFEGIGTMYVTPAYVRINSTESNLAVSQDELILDVIIQENDPANVEVHFFGDYANQLAYEWKEGKLHIKIVNLASTTLVGGEAIPMSISGSGTTATFTVNITAARVTGYELLNGQNEVVSELPIEITEGLEIDLTTINIRKNMSDGSSSIIHPTRLDGYDKDGTVGAEQTVKAFYGESEDDYKTLKVTLLAKTVASISMSAQPTKTVYTIGTDTALELTGAKILVNYNNGTSETIDVTTAMIDETTYNLTAASAYNVKVTYGGQNCTFPITVKDAAVTVTSIAIVGTPAKTTYKLNERIVAETDLAGATVTANMSNGTTTENIPITDAMISYDFSAAGSAQITVTYEGQNATIDVTVVDYATALNVTPTETVLAYSRKASLDIISKATYSLTMASGANKPITEGVTASEVRPGLVEIEYSYTDEYGTLTATQEYEIWYEVYNFEGAGNPNTVVLSDWEFMQSHRDGYYRLVEDLDFSGKNMTPLGTQIVYSYDNGNVTTCNPTESAASTPKNEGVPFTGKFDGQNHEMKWAKVTGGSFNVDGFGLSIFGCIGEGGEVKNIKFSNYEIQSFNQSAIVATQNYGLIENIMILTDTHSSIKTNYGTAGVIAYNFSGGTVRNVVSYKQSSLKSDGSVSYDLPVVNKNNQGGTVEHCYSICDADFLEASKALDGVGDWAYRDGVGPTWDPFAILTLASAEVPINGSITFTIKLSHATLGDFAIIRPASGADNDVYYSFTDNGDGSYTLDLKSHQTINIEDRVSVGEKVKLLVSTSGAGYATAEITITAAQEGL